MTGRTLSVVVPCLNEEAEVANTVNGLVRTLDSMRELVSSYEIVVVDDGSTDGTGAIADGLASRDARVRSVHNERNRGLGFSYRRGVQEARLEYVILVPGDNEFDPASLREILRHLGEADILIPVAANSAIRPAYRRFLSRSFTALINALTGFKVGYYNGHVVQRRELVRQVDFRSNGFAYQAEILCEMLARGHTYREAPFLLSHASHRVRVFRLKTVVGVLWTVARIGLRYRLLKRPSRERPNPRGG